MSIDIRQIKLKPIIFIADGKSLGKMKDYVKAGILIVLMILMIIWINNGINSYDMRFYSGKDGGMAVRFESVVIFSSLFFLIVSKGYNILLAFLGFAVGIFSYVLFLLIGHYCGATQLLIHIGATLLSIVVFFIGRYIYRFQTKKELLIG